MESAKQLTAQIAAIRELPRDSDFSVISVIKDILSTTKPRVMSLLLISTACPMVLAAGREIDFSMLCWVLVGGALVSGSAAAMNCIWDRDIDIIMERTKNRPIAAGRLSALSVFCFALLIGFLGLVILGYRANPTAAAVALFGHFFYVFVYSIWLKRTTSQNIVIGGAAGAVPPIVGWVAVMGTIDLNALLLFLIVFLWTPPHFWALAINKNRDYQRAGVPMLPVTVGAKKTIAQMFWYSFALIPASMLLISLDNRLGVFSLVVMTLLGISFSGMVYMLSLDSSDSDRRTNQAWKVFGFSLIYLSLFFVCLVVDSVVV